MNEIPELKLSVLRKLINRFKSAPGNVLTNLFGKDQWDSEDIEWESQVGNRGLTPFGSEDQPAPKLVPSGVAEHKAHAAFWHEKFHFPASFLNNLRKAGTKQQKQRAKRTIAKEMRTLRNRCERRKEWMFVKMLGAGSFSYIDSKLKTVSVDYGIPTDHIVTLASSAKWSADTCNIVSDIMDASITMSNANGASLDYAIFTSEVLKYMVVNPSIQTLLKKSAYGSGDLFSRPKQVLGDLLNIKNMVLYDEQYQVRAWLTSALASGAGPHTIYVDDVTDFEVGATLTVLDTSDGSKETVTISAVSATGGTLTATGTLSSSYKAAEDLVYMTKKFVPTDKFIMFASEVEGQKIAEFAEAPFGLDGTYGMKVDAWDKKDPDGRFVRVQNKGLPVLYFEDAMYILDVL